MKNNSLFRSIVDVGCPDDTVSDIITTEAGSVPFDPDKQFFPNRRSNASASHSRERVICLTEKILEKISDLEEHQD